MCDKALRESLIVVDMLNRLDDFVDQLHGHSRDDPLSFRESTL